MFQDHELSYIEPNMSPAMDTGVDNGYASDPDSSLDSTVAVCRTPSLTEMTDNHKVGMQIETQEVGDVDMATPNASMQNYESELETMEEVSTMKEVEVSKSAKEDTDKEVETAAHHSEVENTHAEPEKDLPSPQPIVSQVSAPDSEEKHITPTPRPSPGPEENVEEDGNDDQMELGNGDWHLATPEDAEDFEEIVRDEKLSSPDLQDEADVFEKSLAAAISNVLAQSRPVTREFYGLHPSISLQGLLNQTKQRSRSPRKSLKIKRKLNVKGTRRSPRLSTAPVPSTPSHKIAMVASSPRPRPSPSPRKKAMSPGRYHRYLLRSSPGYALRSWIPTILLSHLV